MLRELDQGRSVREIKTMVIEHDLRGKVTQATRVTAWDRINARYLADQNEARILARMVVRAPDRETGRLVLFYELCRSNPLVRDVTVECAFPRYAGGYTAVDKAIIQKCFDGASEGHPELAEWPPQTRGKVISNILTILRDFGLLHDTQRKQFSHLYVLLAAFVYVMYQLAVDGITAPRRILDVTDWRLFFLEQTDALTLLDEASTAGHCSFLHQGDSYTLDLRYPSLEACVDALTAKV